MFKRDFVVVLLTLAVVVLTGYSQTGPQAQGTNVTTGPPEIVNGTLSLGTVTTLMPGTGSGYFVYSLTNEDTTNGIRCEYGGTSGQAPFTLPTATVGSLVAPQVTLVERSAPSNRLDCTTTAGTVKFDLVRYPK